MLFFQSIGVILIIIVMWFMVDAFTTWLGAILDRHPAARDVAAAVAVVSLASVVKDYWKKK